MRDQGTTVLTQGAWPVLVDVHSPVNCAHRDAGADDVAVAVNPGCQRHQPRAMDLDSCAADMGGVVGRAIEHVDDLVGASAGRARRGPLRHRRPTCALATHTGHHPCPRRVRPLPVAVAIVVVTVTTPARGRHDPCPQRSRHLPVRGDTLARDWSADFLRLSTTSSSLQVDAHRRAVERLARPGGHRRSSASPGAVGSAGTGGLGRDRCLGDQPSCALAEFTDPRRGRVGAITGAAVGVLIVVSRALRP